MHGRGGGDLKMAIKNDGQRFIVTLRQIKNCQNQTKTFLIQRKLGIEKK